MRRGGRSTAHSGQAGAASYDNPVLGGTDQGTNSAHSADAANANVTGQYDNRERLLSVEPAAANRAKKLVRNILKKLRSK
jgi:alanine dehydrogenase